MRERPPFNPSHDDLLAHAILEFAKTNTSLAHAVDGLGIALRENNNNKAVLQRIAEMESLIMATNAEISAQLTADLQAANDQLRKLVLDTAGLQPAVDALNVKIGELEALVAAGGAISQELIAAVADTKALAQNVDNNVPELVPVPVIIPPTEPAARAR